MVHRLFRFVAIGIALASSTESCVADDITLLQMNRRVTVEKMLDVTPLVSVTLAVDQALAQTSISSATSDKTDSILPATELVEVDQFSADISGALEKKPVPLTLSEFASTAPKLDRLNRYSHIAYDVEYHTLGEELITLPMRRPRTFNLLMATTKTWLADMVVQLAERRAKGSSDGIDWRRSCAFAAFGFFYVGLVQWVLYVTVMTDLCPNAITFSNEPLSVKLHNYPGQVDLAKQVVMDNCFFAVMIYFPVFYVVKEIMNGSRSPFSDALKTYKGNFLGDNAASMAFWIPGDFIAFAAPMFLRLPLDHCVSFIWTMYLSYKRGSSASATPPKDLSGSSSL